MTKRDVSDLERSTAALLLCMTAAAEDIGQYPSLTMIAELEAGLRTVGTHMDRAFWLAREALRAAPTPADGSYAAGCLYAAEMVYDGWLPPVN